MDAWKQLLKVKSERLMGIHIELLSSSWVWRWAPVGDVYQRVTSIKMAFQSKGLINPPKKHSQRREENQH